MIRYIQITFVIMVVSMVLLIMSAFSCTSDVAPLGNPIGSEEYAIAKDSEKEVRKAGAAGYRGIEIFVPRGTEVVSTLAGTVIEAQYSGKYGLTVSIENEEGYLVRFGHLDAIAVKNGETVERGQVIGKTGNTGQAKTPRLHYEVYYRGERLDPEDTF